MMPIKITDLSIRLPSSRQVALIILPLCANLLLIGCLQNKPETNRQPDYWDVDSSSDSEPDVRDQNQQQSFNDAHPRPIHHGQHTEQQEVQGTIGSEQDDPSDVMLLNQDEVVQQNDVLRYLESASKEEIEEILQDNPEIQKNLVSKIHKVVKDKQQSQPEITSEFENNYRFENRFESASSPSNRPPPSASGPSMPMPGSGPGPYPGDFPDDYCCYDGPIVPDKALLYKYKLKDKANKWIRISKGLKGKIALWKMAKGKAPLPYPYPYPPPPPPPPGYYGPPPPPGGELIAHKDYSFHFDVFKTKSGR